jgi:hypothetical protein
MNPIIGSEAISAGALTRGTLRWNYRSVHPDVYLPRGATTDLVTDAHAAWLWSRRTGVVSGRAAAALHGVEWLADPGPIELIGPRVRRTPGVLMRCERLADDEICRVRGLPVTSAARTAFDLARRMPRLPAVLHLDALAARTGVTSSDIDVLVQRYRGARGVRSIPSATCVMDAGARSRNETRIRLLLGDARLRPPQTDIVVRDGEDRGRVAMGWDDVAVGVNDEANQYLEELELLQRAGWLIVRVRPEDRAERIVFRVRRALHARGWRRRL